MIDKEILVKEYNVYNKSLSQIGREYGVVGGTIKNWLVKYNIRIKEKNNKRKDLENTRFGRLTALYRMPNETSGRYRYRSRWVCRCDCGKETIVDKSALLGGATKSCGCLQKERVYKGYEDLGGQQWSRIKHQAKIRNLEFRISIRYAWDLFIAQNKKCAISKIPIELRANYIGKISNNTASLDRIDNTKGYLENNVQWVHKRINVMKNNMSQDEFIQWCKRVAQNT